MFDATIATQMVTVLIVDDNVVEDTEFINLTLTSVDNAVMLNPATARINIKDVDSELSEAPSFYANVTSFMQMLY